ncbi:MAG: FAD-dependent oxidoreductase [Hyphomonadaceae bacterium]|nr:FAD-dependent oxidoreductase [Hyphomonadaceae bacterium]
MKDLKTDLGIIGAGSAGLSVAAGAAQLGLQVVLFERGEMGGDCLNYGCVPSKALIAVAKVAHKVRGAARFGVQTDAPRIDWPAVKAHMERAIAAIAPHDSQARFEGLGVQVIREHARFLDERTVASASVRVRARRFVIATGSCARIPDIPGLGETPFLTNESIFHLDTLPRKLLILGAGPIGLELGQAFRRLGSDVTIVEAARTLGSADREAADLLAMRLRAEGVEILEGCKATKVSAGPTLEIESADGARRTLEGSHLLVAVGRTLALDDLDLHNAGVDPRRLSATLRTSNPRVWMLGDAAGRELFTHAAGWHASVFVRNVLFKARTPAHAQRIPSVVYCEPELAQIGLTEAQAPDAKAVRADFAANDRAVCEGESIGFAKLLIAKSGRLLGATILGPSAGELIAPLALAISSKLTVRTLTSPVLAYPTRSEIWKRAAGAYYTPALFSARTRALVSVLQRIP